MCIVRLKVSEDWTRRSVASPLHTDDKMSGSRIWSWWSSKFTFLVPVVAFIDAVIFFNYLNRLLRRIPAYCQCS